MLRELELLPLARLYGLEAKPTPRPADTMEVAEPQRHVPGDAAPQGLRMLVAKRAAAGETARWALVGESFDGPAGALLDNMLNAIGYRRESEQAAFAERDLKRLAPKLVVALGDAAAARLLEAGVALASLRGQVHRYDDLPVVVTFAPARLLAHGAEKALAWEDLILARTTAADR